MSRVTAYRCFGDFGNNIPAKEVWCGFDTILENKSGSRGLEREREREK
jgi:hypothetical protein